MVVPVKPKTSEEDIKAEPTAIKRETESPELVAEMPLSGTELAKIFSELGAGDPSLFEMKVRTAWSKVRHKQNEKEKLAVEEEHKITYMLSKLLHVWEIPQDFAKRTKLQSFLGKIMDPANKFSEGSVATARKLYDRFDAQDWGKPEEVVIISDDETEHITAESSTRGTKRRKGIDANIEGTVRTSRSQPSSKKTKLRYPDADHPAYGKGGVMDGIILRRNLASKRDSRLLDPSRSHRSAKVFGHNNLQVGQWWPMQICLVRDGGHGSSQGGIYGNEATGAFSVTVSGNYSDLDHDESYSRLLYSAPRAPDGDAGVNKDSMGLKALRGSIATRQPFRLFRGASKEPHAPTVGYRYDGLFEVKVEDWTENEKGELYSLFLLERRGGQAEKNTTRPTFEDKKAYILAQKNF